MRAAWYDRQGSAQNVLTIGEITTPEPAPGEVRVRLHYSGINPGDTKKRRGWHGSTMPYPRVVPHSDGAGVIEAIGDGVDPSRIGQRVWVYGAQSYRAFGTAAEYTVVPSDLAVHLPDAVTDEIGACLGIPGITAHRAVFADGPVTGQTIIVQGVLGGVGRPGFPFWPMLFANITIRLLGSDDFPEIAAAHDQVDAGSRARVLLAIG